MRSSVREQDGVIVRLEIAQRERTADVHVADEIEACRSCNFSEFFFTILQHNQQLSARKNKNNNNNMLYDKTK